MSWVIDASVALKWVLDEAGEDEALGLLSDKICAPDLMLIEAANALWSRARRGHLTSAQAERRLRQIQTAPVEWTRDPGDMDVALNLAFALQHPVYDCVYLAVALRENRQVVTADTRFIRAVSVDPVLSARVRSLV